MKSVGIITIHNSTNYGASLQAFALYSYIQRLGYDVSVIDLHRPVHNDYLYSSHFLSYHPVKKDSLNGLKIFIKRLLPKYRYLYKSFDSAEKKFKKFNNAVKQTRAYRKIDDLYADPPFFDIYVAGSDQIWNPFQPFCIEPYFLTFVPKGSKKLSYAASIGVATLSEKEKSDYKNWLESFDALSIRENTAKLLLEEIVDKEITCVPDPSFLISQEAWSSYSIEPDKDGKYILLYTIRRNDFLLNLANKLSQVVSCKVIVLNHALWNPRSDGNVEYVGNAGPNEFLGFIKKASCVLTDSFHGTVFSILMKTRNFYAFVPVTNLKGGSRGSRITDLLSTFQLEDHIISEANPVENLEALYNNIIDLDRVSRIIAEESQVGQKFLQENL